MSKIEREALLGWAKAHDIESRELMTLREMICVDDESGASVPADAVYAELHEIIASSRKVDTSQIHP